MNTEVLSYETGRAKPLLLEICARDAIFLPACRSRHYTSKLPAISDVSQLSGSMEPTEIAHGFDRCYLFQATIKGQKVLVQTPYRIGCIELIE